MPQISKDDKKNKNKYNKNCVFVLLLIGFDLSWLDDAEMELNGSGKGIIIIYTWQILIDYKFLTECFCIQIHNITKNLSHINIPEFQSNQTNLLNPQFALFCFLFFKTLINFIQIKFNEWKRE